MTCENEICPSCGIKLLKSSQKRARQDLNTTYRCSNCGYTSADKMAYPVVGDASLEKIVVEMLNPSSPWPVQLTGNEAATIAYYIIMKTVPINEDGSVTLKVKCDSCQATGLYQGDAEPDGVHVVCVKCGGSGSKELNIPLFTGRKLLSGVEEVRFSAEQGYPYKFEGTPDSKWTYEEFLTIFSGNPIPEEYESDYW